MRYIVDIAKIIATILGFLFPAYLINAIRGNGEKTGKDKVKACLAFGAIVLIIMLFLDV